MVDAKFFSAGIVPILRKESNLILLLRVYNYWDFPKGRVEPGEDPLEAAKRELAEETGLNKVDFPFGVKFIETEPYNKGKIARYYIGEVFFEKVVLGINPELGRPEHQEYRWVHFEEAERLLGERVLKVLHWAQNIVED